MKDKKEQLEKTVRQNIQALTHKDASNNAYLAEIKLRKKTLKPHGNLCLTAKKKRKLKQESCEHIAEIKITEFNVVLVCSKCGVLIAKVDAF